MPAALPRWRICRKKCATPPTRWTPWATPQRRSRRATRSARRASARSCCSRPTPRTSTSSLPTPTQFPYFAGCRAQLLAVQPLCRGRPVLRRAAALPVRRDGYDGGRPRRRQGCRGGPAAIQGEAGHHGRQGQAGLRGGGRHADQGGDQGDDHPVDAAGPLAARGVSRHQPALSPTSPRRSRRWARCCSA